MSEPIREIPAENLQDVPCETAPRAQFPMRWHGFVAGCMLWLAAAVHLAQAGWIFSGKIYYTPEVRAQVYAGIPAMPVIDYALAACLVIAAALQLAARGKLAKTKWAGTRLLTAAYAVLALSQLCYALARFMLVGLSPLSIPVIAQVLAYAALLLVNRSYYRKRRSAFE